MGLNEPPNTAIRATLLANLTVAVDDVLGGRQLLNTDRATRVQTRRRDAHFGAHPELPTVDEARGSIDHDGGGVDLAREAPRVGERVRHDGLGQARAVTPDVSDHLLDVVDRAERSSTSSPPQSRGAAGRALGSNATVRGQPRNSPPASASRDPTRGKNWGAVVAWTRSVSSALQTLGRLTFAFITIATATSRSASASTKT